MTPLLPVLVFLLCSLDAQGSRAVTPVFVQKGDDVHLEIMKDEVPGKFILFLWKLGENVLVTFTPDSEPKVTESYTGRVEFSVENYSMKLKNLQETDSGRYTGQLIEFNKAQILTEYDVTVENPVSPVVLTVDSVSSSSDSCNLTVTCRTQDSHITKTYRCDKLTCSYQGGANDDSINVTVQEGVIICNHSNHMSWENDTMDIKTYCPEKESSSGASITGGAVTGVVVPGLVFVVIWFK